MGKALQRTLRSYARYVLLPSDLASVMIVSKLHGEKASTEDYNSGKAAIGTGPYKFAEYVPNQRVVLKANYGYWGGESEEDRHLAGFTVSAPIGIRARNG